MLFLTTSTISGQSPSAYRWGALTNNTTYPGGQFVFINNGTNFGQLSTATWSSIAEDLAFTATLNSLLMPALPVGAPINPTNVAAAIDVILNSNVALPAGFNNLFALTPDQLVAALTAMDGENATQAQTGAFMLGTLYLSLLTDPNAMGRTMASGPGAPIPYAAESSGRKSAASSAFAMYTKAPPVIYQPRWDVWGAALGGANNLRGDAAIGSTNTDTRAGAVAAGADYRFSPDSLIGFSLAGGGTQWRVGGNAFGNGGRGWSDAFLAGVYGKVSNGAGYVSAAATYANYWMNTSRTVTVAGLDQLDARFNAESYGGRIEGGWRLPNQALMAYWTPYAAFQAQAFHTPNYGEVAVVGLNQFALNFASRTATDYRGEVGLRGDKLVVTDGGVLSLFSKLAYAHDEVSRPLANANFTVFGIGGAPFTVFGARPSRDLALVTLGGDWRLANGWSFLTKFDGEFGANTATYSGTGRLRYTW